MASWGNNSNSSLSKLNMNDIVYKRSHCIACKGRKENERYYSVINTIVLFEIWDQCLSGTVSMSIGEPDERRSAYAICAVIHPKYEE